MTRGSVIVYTFYTASPTKMDEQQMKKEVIYDSVLLQVRVSALLTKYIRVPYFTLLEV